MFSKCYPYEYSGDCGEGEKDFSRFAVSCCDGSELFDFEKKFFNQMAFFINLFVKRHALFAMFTRGYNRHYVLTD